MRAASLAILLILAGSLSADVVVLKDGSRHGGRLVEKASHVELTTEAGLRTWLKEEVERIIKDPKELLGDAEALFTAAKADFQRGAALQDLNAQSDVMKEAAGKLTKARELVAGTREFFPDDKYAGLDNQLVQIMQLMRMVRERIGSEIARSDGRSRPGLVNAPPPPPGATIEEAFSILTDPGMRNDPAARAKARDAFRVRRSYHPELYEVATAAMLFLSKPEVEWKMDGPTAAALQEYFNQPWLKDPGKISSAQHQAAAQWVSDKLAALRKSSPSQAEPIQLFGIGHLGHAPAGGEQDKTARLLGLQVQNGILGTPEGFAVRDMNSWSSTGDYDLAVLSFVKEHRGADTPIVRFVWSYALLRLVQARKQGWSRPVSALGTVNVSDAVAKGHVVALVNSIKKAANCNVCLGEGRLRCTNCHGKTEQRTDCTKCKGSGKIREEFGRGFLGEELPCYPCRGRGFMKLIKCLKCKDGWNDCKQCPEAKAPPNMEDICSAEDCTFCDARGFVFKKVLWACKSCMGLGQKLVPTADPAKRLP